MSGFLIQSRFGANGNFEVVVPDRTSRGGLVHFFRNNDDPSLPWSGPTYFGESLGNFDGASLIQSNFSSPGNLEVVASVGGNLFHFFRDSGPSFTWNGPIFISDGVSGNPGLIQSRFGTQGNFEVVVPASGGGLLHFYRNNDDPSFPWSRPTPFGGTGAMESVSLIQSNFGNPGNLEVVASDGNNVFAFWRDSGPSFTWNASVIFENVDSPSLIQSRFGSQGNFEMVAAKVGDPFGGILHFYRNNDDSSFPWSRGTFVVSNRQFFPVSLIQSNFGSPGNLEVLAAAFNPITASFDELDHFWRDSGPSFAWNGPFIAETGI